MGLIWVHSHIIFITMGPPSKLRARHQRLRKKGKESVSGLQNQFSFHLFPNIHPKGLGLS
jgi:hypothetical protein